MESSNERGDETNKVDVIVLAHCILNQATRWQQSGKTPKTQGLVTEVLEALSARKIGAIQLPCPEFTFCGTPRPPRTKDEYENLPGFRLHCERLAKTSASDLKTLSTMGRKTGIRILAVMGVERSPTCGVKCTPRTVGGKAEYMEENGLFFEILEKELENLGLKIPFIEIDLHEPAEFCKRLNEILK